MTEHHHHLAKEYLSARSGTADRTFEFCNEDAEDICVQQLITETHTNKPLVWAIPNLLTQEEHRCVLKQCVEQQEAFQSCQLQVQDIFGEGMQDLAQELLPRLQHDYSNQQKELGGINTSDKAIYSVAPSWRVVKLDEEEEFPAHRDGMLSSKLNGVFAVSTHTVLLEFSKDKDTSFFGKQPSDDASSSTDSFTDTSSFPSDEGDYERSNHGAIRFYYRQYPFDGPYDYCVDVHIPPGWALVMEQRPDLWYALQPSGSSTRYVAQTAMLQALPPGRTVESLRKGGKGAFALGPGLLELFEDMVALAFGEDAPRGWGQQGVHPKTTLWRYGRPMIRSPDLLVRQERPRDHRWSMIDPRTNPRPSTARRRQSLQWNVDPIRKQVSYEVNPKFSGTSHLADRDDTSITADYSSSHSTSLEDDLMPCFIAAMEDRKRQEDEKRRSVVVTRKPRRDSLVGKRMASLQNLDASGTEYYGRSSRAASVVSATIVTGKLVD